MFTAGDFRDVVSGTRRGPLATIQRATLAVAEVPYTLAVRFRNRRYDRGLAAVHSVEVPVISVGNLTLGGTGKTPMVQYLATWFRARGIRVSIVSRGYRATTGEGNDEAKELAERLPSVPHLQSPDRVASARIAVDELRTQLILLDDGFQHRRLVRDLDVVLIDALEPFGFDRVFPRGMLREPVRGLSRAHVIGLSRADLLDGEQRESIRRRVSDINAEAIWLELAHRPQRLLGHGMCEDLEAVRDKEVLAFCGIGNPMGFRQTLVNCGARIQAFREFPDHHRYSRKDIQSLADWAQAHPSRMVICTHKDLVKIDIDQFGDSPLRALEIELHILRGQHEFETSLSGIIAPLEGHPGCST